MHGQCQVLVGIFQNAKKELQVICIMLTFSHYSAVVRGTRNPYSGGVWLLVPCEGDCEGKLLRGWLRRGKRLFRDLRSLRRESMAAAVQHTSNRNQNQIKIQTKSKHPDPNILNRFTNVFGHSGYEVTFDDRSLSEKVFASGNELRRSGIVMI